MTEASIRPRIAALLTVVVALLVVTAPVAADHTVVVSVHTTDTDFANARTLANMSVSGSGQSASVVWEGGSNLGEATRDSDNSVASGVTDKRGILINTNEQLAGVNVTISSNTQFATTAYILDANGNVVGQASISGGGASITTASGPLAANTDYYLVVDAGGSSYDAGYYDGIVTGGSSGLDIKNEGWANGGEVSNSYGIVSASGISYTGEGEYLSSDHDATNAADGFTDLQIANANATVEWQGYDGSTWQTVATNTYTTGGNKSVSLSGGYDRWRVRVTTTNAGEYDYSVSIAAEGVTAPTNAPTVDNSSADPQGGETVNTDPVTLSIDVSDADFPTAQGDSVTVEFFGNGNSVGTDTVTSNGTASTTWSPELGSADWYAVATDSYGHTATSDTFSFETPSTLTFRNETNATQIITGTTAQVTFYSADGTIVIQKTDNDGDGKIDLAGLPNVPFVVTVDADGYYNRRIYFDSIYEQQNIYLLNTTAYGGSGAVNTTFVYEDRTGQFEQANTTLEIQRAVDVDGDDTFAWEVVAGDFWGAAGEFPFAGQTQARYRLVIENQQTGDRRVLGTHVPTDDGVKNIIVGNVIFDAGNATGRYFDAGINQNTSNLQILYSDPANGTSDVTIVVHEQGNESAEIYNQTFAGPLGTKTISLALTDNQTDTNYVVEYDGTHASDGAIYGKTIVGGGTFPLPIDGDILSAFVYVFITFIMALYGPRTALLGAWAGVFVFAGAAMLGWVNGVTVAVPVLIAIGATFYSAATP